MKRILIWDIPTRVFHWLLAGTFIASFAIANLFDDDSPTFAVHMLLGLIMSFMVLLRVVWGFVGTRYARFATFLFGPGAILEYFHGTITGRGKRHIGHNPGSSVAIYLILALTLGMAVTGLLHSSGGEVVEELHEALAWAFVTVVGVHVAGVLWHTVRHRENLTLSMLDGRKQGETSQGIASAHSIAGLVFLLLVGGWSWQLVSGYDAATGQLALPLTGQTLQLAEGAEREGQAGKKHETHDDDDDDDD